MWRSGIGRVLVIVTLSASSAWAQEKARTLCGCEPCPWSPCVCAPETLEVTFDGSDRSNLVVDASMLGSTITATIIIHTRKTDDSRDWVQGWSYGVSHDVDVLTLTSATSESTDMMDVYENGFLVTSLQHVETCIDERCTETRPGGGWISAVVLGLTAPAWLPPDRRSSVARATYVIDKLPGSKGSLIGFTHRLRRGSGPPVATTLTMGGRAFVPSKVVEGFLTENPDEGSACPDPALYFGGRPTEDDLLVGNGDVLGISIHSSQGIVGFALGVKATLSAESTTWEFTSGVLGQDPANPIRVELVNERDEFLYPWTPNTARSAPRQQAVSIERGSAIQALKGADLLVYDLAPSVGGPGFTAGYITDLESPPGSRRTIPPTQGGGACEAHEILRVHLAEIGAPFRRGDADADGSITIRDAILAIPVGARSGAAVDCDDSMDADDDGRLTVLDVIFLVQYLFQRGREIPPPFATCGVDPTPDRIGCRSAGC